MAVAPEDRDQQDVAPQTQGSPSPVNSGGGGDSPPKGPKAPMPGAEPAPAVEITDQMEREINEALAKAADPAAPAPSGKTPAIRGPRVVQAGREHRTGRVVSVGPEDLFVEFGPKELGVASRNQWKPEETPAVGSSLELVVDRFDANEQIFVCSRPGAVQKADWEMLEPGQIVEARVTGSNKGGLELEIANHRAFMPASLVDVRRVDDLSVFVGEKVRCLVKRVDRSGAGNILLSRRDVVAQEMKERKAELKGTLEPGQVVDGTVRKIMDFGAFVDIGGIDGLLHISDLSHERVAKVEDVVKEGDSVRVKILKIDWDKNRISLGMKQTAPDPWQSVGESVPVGEIVSGRVTKLLEFGAFVEVAPGLEGLVHISELAWKRVATVDSVLKADQVVKVKVLEVDPGKKRISLSVKQTTEAPANMRKGKGEDQRTEEEIRQETPAQRRMREKFQSRGKSEGLKSGLGDVGALGQGLGGLSLEKFKGG